MIHYSAGLLFDNEKEHVALIHKNRGPDINIGKWTAIGGKEEADEGMYQCQLREFHEETGLRVVDWDDFLQVTGKGYIVFFYKAFVPLDQLAQIETMEDEKVTFFHIHQLQYLPLARNLEWIIPVALDEHILDVRVIDDLNIQL